MNSVRAVVFDLFGTVVTWRGGRAYRQAIAERLGMTHDEFLEEWVKTHDERNSGALATIDALRRVCVARQRSADDGRLAAAAAVLVDFFRQTLVPRPGAREAIAELRRLDLKIGLLTACPEEVPAVYAETPVASLFDAAVFSCVERTLKPDVRLYATVAERLGVPPSTCLYVGNGDGEELAGALRAGMSAVLFTAPGETPGSEARGWSGERIADLREVPALVRRD